MAETPMQSIVDWREFREFGVVVLNAERPILRLKGS